MILCAAGGIEHDKLVDLANKHLGDVSNQYEATIPFIGTPRFTGSEIRDRDDAMPLTHAVIAFEGPPAESPENLAMMIAALLPGSWDKSHMGSASSAVYWHNATAQVMMLTFIALNIFITAISIHHCGVFMLPAPR